MGWRGKVMIVGVWGKLVGASETGERGDLYYSDLSIELQ